MFISFFFYHPDNFFLIFFLKKRQFQPNIRIHFDWKPKGNHGKSVRQWYNWVRFERRESPWLHSAMGMMFCFLFLLDLDVFPQPVGQLRMHDEPLQLLFGKHIKHFSKTFPVHFRERIFFRRIPLTNIFRIFTEN